MSELKKCLMSILKNMEDKDGFGEILNIILVIYDCRKSSLIETANFHNVEISSEFWRNFELIKECYPYLKLKKDTLDSPRYLVYKNSIYTDEYVEQNINNDTGVGQLLDFEFKDHYNFSNNNINRLSFSFIETTKDIQFYAEVAELNKITENNINNLREKQVLFNNCLNNFGYNVELEEAKMHSLTFLFKKLSEYNLDFYKENIKEYESFFENYYFGGDIFFISKTFEEIHRDNPNLEALFKLFKIIYDNRVNIDYCYDEVSRTVSNIDKIYLKMAEWDNFFWDNLNERNLMGQTELTLSLVPPARGSDGRADRERVEQLPEFHRTSSEGTSRVAKPVRNIEDLPPICKRDFNLMLRRYILKNFFNEVPINEVSLNEKLYLISYLNEKSRKFIETVSRFCINNYLYSKKKYLYKNALKIPKQDFYKIKIDNEHDEEYFSDFSDYINITNEISIINDYRYLGIPFNSCSRIISKLNTFSYINLKYFIQLLIIGGQFKIFINRNETYNYNNIKDSLSGTGGGITRVPLTTLFENNINVKYTNSYIKITKSL